jgi:hypothetical protein
MFAISRIRSVLAVLVAAACVAVAVGSVIPDAQARPNDGRYKKSQEAKRQQRLCDDLHSTLHDQGVIFDQAIADKDTATAGRVLDDMYATFDAAKKAGCSWAARVVLPPPPLPQQTAPPPPVAAAPSPPS